MDVDGDLFARQILELPPRQPRRLIDLAGDREVPILQRRARCRTGRQHREAPSDVVLPRGQQAPALAGLGPPEESSRDESHAPHPALVVTSREGNRDFRCDTTLGAFRRSCINHVGDLGAAGQRGSSLARPQLKRPALGRRSRRAHRPRADRLPRRHGRRLAAPQERLLALRDTMMADNLSAMADREAHPRGPTLVFAHTSTCARELAGGSWPTWTCAGTLPGPCWPPDSTMPTWSSGRRSAPHHTWRSPNPDVKHPARLAVHAALRCSSPASGPTWPPRPRTPKTLYRVADRA